MTPPILSAAVLVLAALAPVCRAVEPAAPVAAASDPSSRLRPVVGRLQEGRYSSDDHSAVDAALKAIAEQGGLPTAAKLAAEAARAEAAFWGELTPGQKSGRLRFPAEQGAEVRRRIETLLGLLPQTPGGQGAAVQPEPPPGRMLTSAGTSVGLRTTAIPADLADYAVSAMFWDGKNRGHEAPRDSPVAAWDTRPGPDAAGGKTSASVSRPGLKVGPVPFPEKSSSPAAAASQPTGAPIQAADPCEAALRSHPDIAKLCREHPVVAPLLAGLLEVFKEQFGTIQGIVLSLVFMLMGLLLSVLSGFGLVAKVAVSLASLALLAATLGPLLKAGWDAGRALLKSQEGSQERADALLKMGRVGGKVLILALMAAVGYGIGKSRPGRAMVDSMTSTMSNQLRKLGVADGAASLDLRLSPALRTKLETWFGPSAAAQGDPAPDADRNLTGQPATINPAETPGNRMALQRQNDAARLLAANGYKVQQNGLQAGPDYLINGVGHDAYAPTTGSPRNIWATINGKSARGQAHSFVIILDGSSVDASTLGAEFSRFPIPGLGRILIVRGGKVAPLKIPAPAPAGN